MEYIENLPEIVQLHGDLSANAVAIIGFFNNGMDAIPPFVASTMSNLFCTMNRLARELYFDSWYDEENESLAENTPALIKADYERISAYTEIFEDWNTDKDTIIQTLSYLIGDISRFYFDLSKEFPYEEDHD
jgi:hypothetical protein